MSTDIFLLVNFPNEQRKSGANEIRKNYYNLCNQQQH